MTNIFFYETKQYLDTEFSKKQADLLVSRDINRLINNQVAKKVFKEEIYPTIMLAKFLNVPFLKFCGMECNSIDAILKNNDGTIINVECTTSIDEQYNKLVCEYNRDLGSCFIGPHSKAYKINEKEKANSNDIVYSGTKHKRKFINQEDLNNKNSIENCIVNINIYVKKDMEKIQEKINKGNKENKYKNFCLILTCDHNIDINEISEYQKLVYDIWNNISNNPFSSLFVVNYDVLLFKQCNYNPELNAYFVPIPLLFLKK